MTTRRSDHPQARLRAPSFLDSVVSTKQVIVCCGAGGVGKTTTSAAIGIAAAMRGRRALVLTIDPARRLAEAMGIRDGGREPSRVDPEWFKEAGVTLTGSVDALMLDPRSVFEGMVRRLTTDEARVKEILENRLYRHVAELVAGMQEYTAAEALYTLASQEKYDVIVLDTPPSRNALEFLEAPRRLASFLDERIIGIFLAKKGGLFRAATGLVANVFDRIFGAGFYKDLQGFLGAFSGMFGSLRGHAEGVRQLLTSDAATFVLVTSPEPAAIEEARFFQRRIDELGVPFSGVVLNRSWAYTRGLVSPDRIAPENASPALRSGIAKLTELGRQERRRAEHDRALLASLQSRNVGSGAIATPHLAGAVSDLAGLIELAKNLVGEEEPPDSQVPQSTRGAVA